MILRVHLTWTDVQIHIAQSQLMNILQKPLKHSNSTLKRLNRVQKFEPYGADLQTGWWTDEWTIM